MIELFGNFFELVSRIGDYTNCVSSFVTDFLLKLLDELRLFAHGFDRILEVLLPGDRKAYGFCEIAEEVKIRPELIIFGMAGKQHGTIYVLTRIVVFVEPLEHRYECCASVIQCWCQRGSHYADAGQVPFRLIAQRVPSLLPGNIDRDQNRRDASHCLHPCGLFTGRKSAPSNPFAIHTVPSDEWGKS